MSRDLRATRRARGAGEPDEALAAVRAQPPADAPLLALVPTIAGGGTPDWRRRYARRLWISDLIVLGAVVYGTQIVWFGLGSEAVAIRADSRLSTLSYWVFSAGLIAAWMWVTSLVDSRSHRVIGTGAAEYVRLVDSSIRLFGVIAIFAFLLRVDVARGFLLISLPLGVLLLVLERWLWRQWLTAKRRSGDYSARVVLVGSRSSVALIARELARRPSAGYVVVGACVPDGRAGTHLAGAPVPILGDVDSVDRAIAASAADTVAIASTDDLPPDRVKQIAWSLEAGRQHLVLAPSIVDVAGPRIHARPVAGLPLIHVETPNFSRGQRFVKRMFDLTVSLIGIVAFSPLLLVLAICVKASGPGPVLFTQTRVGLGGREFRMLKFRSMVSNAEELLPSVLDRQAAVGNEVMFKLEHDPRVTRVGRWMRRFSLDELPQVFNVIAGSMALVGPRPPLPREVEQYADHVHRRFLVKPGITGLWQVSGRSTLSWDDTVRLDLSYVENWSLLGDIVILAKTTRAVLDPQGTTY